MQKLSFYLVQNRISVTTDVVSDGYVTENRQVYQRKLKLYKGIDNTIELEVKGSDQRKLSVIGKTAVVKFYDSDRNNLFTVQGAPILSKTGIVSVTVPKEYISLIDPQLLTLAAYLKDDETSEETILYSDSDFGVAAVVEVYNGYNDASNVIDVVETWIYDMGTRELVSEIVDFKKTLNRNIRLNTGDLQDPDAPVLDTTSTVIVTPNQINPYTGTVTIEGTDDQSLALGNQWSLVATIQPEEFEEKVITANWRFVRFRYPGFKFPGRGATFHVTKENGVYTDVAVVTRGSSYRIGDLITIKGSLLGGDDGINDLTITVLTVNDSPPGALNAVSGISFSGTASSGSGYYRAVKSELLSTTNSIDKITIIN